MRLALWHPSSLTLLALVEGELAPSRARRVRRHLATCVRCRGLVSAARAVATSADSLFAPPVPSDLLDHVLEARRSGTRIILPSPAIARPFGGPPLRKAAALLVVVLGTAALLASLVGTPRLSARLPESELQISPSRPHAGATIEIRYRPLLRTLMRHDSLVLRGRLRTPSSDSYDEGVELVRLTGLRRDGDEFRGSFRLQDGVVFAAVAVETTDSTAVDDRSRRAWRILVHDGRRPSYESLQQQMYDLIGRNWEDAYETARSAVTLYPDEVSAWSMFAFFAGAIAGEAGRDSVREVVRPDILRLEAEARETPGVPARDMVWFYWYHARQDSVAAAYWVDRMARELPSNAHAAAYRALDYTLAHLDEPDRALAWLEDLWAGLDAVDWKSAERIAGFGRALAERAEDDSAYLRWLDREVSAAPWRSPARAMELGRRDGLRAAALPRLRAALALTESWPRALEETGVEHGRRVASLRRRILTALGRGLVLAGNARGGLDTLTLAAEGGWDVDVFRQIAEARRAAGDLAGAAEMYSYLVADPRTTREQADSLTAVGRGVGPERWERLVAAAEARMTRETMLGSVTRPVGGDPQVQDGEGRWVSLSDRLGGGVSVVVFWSRHCLPAVQALPLIRDVARRLDARGIPLLLVANEPPSATAREFVQAQNLSFPVYYDGRHKAAVAFGNWGTPAHYVVDARGRIRFADEGAIDHLLPQVAALSGLDEEGRASTPP